MDKLVLTLLESSVALLMFYFVYLIWLKRETNFRENRFYLLITAVISLLIPWLNFSLPSGSIAETIYVTNLLGVVSIYSTGYEQTLVQQITAWQWVFIVYGLGVLFTIGILSIKMLSITRIDKIAQKQYDAKMPFNVKFIVADVVPFSFLQTIYINPNQFTKKQLNEIIAHENVHINQQHTYDCLFYELLIVFFWFNPIVYKYRNSAKEIHEFLADEGAIRSGISGLEYQKLLFEQATGLVMQPLANSFNYSLIKRRLKMLTKIKSSKLTKFRLLYVVPALLVLVMVFACKQNNSVENLETVISEEESGLLDGNENTNSVKIEEEVYFTVDVMPEFPGGDSLLREYIAMNTLYPSKAKETATEGKVFIQFVVNSEGKVVKVKNIATRVPERKENEVGEIVVVGYSADYLSDGKAYDELEKEAIRVISSLPDWIPGKNDGENVNVEFTVPINFQLD